MPWTEPVRTVRSSAVRLGCMVKLHHAPETATDPAEPLGMFLLIEGDFRLNAHGILP